MKIDQVRESPASGLLRGMAGRHETWDGITGASGKSGQACNCLTPLSQDTRIPTPNPGPLRARFTHLMWSFPELLQKYANFYTLFLNALISHDSRQMGNFKRCCKTLLNGNGRQNGRGLGDNTVRMKRTPVLKPVSDNCRT
jgi:hypothetical protein